MDSCQLTGVFEQVTVEQAVSLFATRCSFLMSYLHPWRASPYRIVKPRCVVAVELARFTVALGFRPCICLRHSFTLLDLAASIAERFLDNRRTQRLRDGGKRRMRYARLLVESFEARGRAGKGCIVYDSSTSTFFLSVAER